MKYIHLQEHEQFKKLFHQENIDRFEDRIKVLKVFLQTEKHVTISELHQILNENGYQAEQNFVRDTMKLMCRFGFAQKNRFENGQIRYEHRHLGQHHDHMICTKCKNILEFKNEALEELQLKISKTYGFHMLQHKMEIYGICSRCLKNHIQPLPLTNARPGERLIIEDFSGGPGARLRLLTMGLRVGDTVDVVTNINTGPVVVAIDQKRYVIGRGLAQKILVKQNK